MGGRQSSQGSTSSGNTRQSTGQASVPVEESRVDRNSTGTNTSRDSSNVDVSRTDQPHGRALGERRREGSSSHSLRVAGRSSRPSSSYAEGTRSVRERVRILPTPTTYSSSAPSTNQPLDISLLLGFRNVSISNVSITRIRCPGCQRRVPITALEEHLSTCLEPKMSYNVSQLDYEAGECIICLEDMLIGDSIARLPCLCVYHQKCIEKWLKIKQCCPEHPTTNSRNAS